MQIQITRGEESSGPYTLEQVQDYLAQGILLPDDLAWHEGLENWVPLTQLVAEAGTPQPPEAIPAPPQPQEAIPAPVQPQEAIPVVAQPVQPAEPISPQPQPAEPDSPQPMDPAPKPNRKKLVVGIAVGLLVLGGGGAATWIFFFKDKPPEIVEVKPPVNPKPPAKPKTDTNDTKPLPPDPNTLIPGLPGGDTNSVPTNPSPTNSIPTTPEPQSASLAGNIKGKGFYLKAAGDNGGMLFEFGKDGKLAIHSVDMEKGEGKVLGEDLPYTVEGLKVTTVNMKGKPATITFASATPGKGDAVSAQDPAGGT
ncbi:uncharacterized protein METZ01_LOCUS244584, partial [marine metagenome]